MKQKAVQLYLGPRSAGEGAGTVMTRPLSQEQVSEDETTHRHLE